MKKKFKYYVVYWLILLLTFNVICFVTPNEMHGMSKFGGSFWSAYVFIMIAFVGQLICTLLAFRKNTIENFFYKVPLITISYASLIAILIAGTLCMIIPELPNWVGIIACFLILAICMLAIVKASFASNIAESLNSRIEIKNSFVKSSTVFVENLIVRTKNEEARSICKKLYESLRFSDPISDISLENIETDIKKKLEELSYYIDKDDTNSLEKQSEEIIMLIHERNSKCKKLK